MSQPDRPDVLLETETNSQYVEESCKFFDEMKEKVRSGSLTEFVLLGHHKEDDTYTAAFFLMSADRGFELVEVMSQRAVQFAEFADKHATKAPGGLH